MDTPTTDNAATGSSTPSNNTGGDVENQPQVSNDANNTDNKSNPPGKKKNNRHMGRNEFRRHTQEKRKQLNDEWNSKRRRINENGESVDTGENGDAKKFETPFTAAEIASEERRPKKKVAVMIGYSGTGYKGMQINWNSKTIEGDLFKAFIAAGAISKANADDPKKSSLARCARTDKGVHAAGNVISLKLIVEDENIVQKINDNLPEQIRVWGITRTSNAFSSYQACDSRWYEYLLPTYCLLPAHPGSFIWKKIMAAAEENNCVDDLKARLGDVWNFWEEVEEKSIKPILERLDPETRAEVLSKIHVAQSTFDGAQDMAGAPTGKTEEAEKTATDLAAAKTEETPTEAATAPAAESTDANGQTSVEGIAVPPSTKPKTRELGPVDFALRDIKATYAKANRDYRVTPDRLEQLQDALNEYLGTVNFHNYTIQKNYSDPSSKRHIKSFKVNMEPIQIRDTQWVSLKVHGQSFMMHQIRKMVSMAVLCVRSATPLSRMKESFGPTRIAIPKMPGLGLLLERPVFEGYNVKARSHLGRKPLDFDEYNDEMQAFKDREIYQRIFELEEKENSFQTFFQQVDNFESPYFLWLTPGGIEAGAIRTGMGDKDSKAIDAGLGDDDEDPEGGEG